jgi:hypothetical protein
MLSKVREYGARMSVIGAAPERLLSNILQRLANFALGRCRSCLNIIR